MTSDETFGWTEERINKAIQALAELPPLPKQEVKILPPEETCACGKVVPVSQLEMLDTGVFRTIGDVCKGCKHGHDLDKTTAKIVCARCKRVIVRVTPSRDKTGFEFKAGKSYHLSECKLCTPEIERCPIIEKVIWDRKHKQH